MNSNDILDMVGDAKGTYVWDAQQLRDHSISGAKRKLALIILAAAMILTLVSCGVATVIYGDSIQEWFSYYWKQLTGHEMEAEQTAIINELSQKIGVSTTDGNLTITVDSATGSENIFYFLVRVEGHQFTQKQRYTFASRRLTVDETVLPDNISVSSFGIHYLGLAENGAGLFLIDYDYATSDQDLGDMTALPMTLYLENMTRRNPYGNLESTKVVEEGKWSISFTLDRSQISEKVTLPDAEVMGMNSDTGERETLKLTNIVLSNTGVKYTFDSKHGTIEPFSGITVLMKNGSSVSGGQGTGIVDDDLTTLNYEWHWSMPLNIDDIVSITIGGTELPVTGIIS